MKKKSEEKKEYTIDEKKVYNIEHEISPVVISHENLGIIFKEGLTSCF